MSKVKNIIIGILFVSVVGYGAKLYLGQAECSQMKEESLKYMSQKRMLDQYVSNFNRCLDNVVVKHANTIMRSRLTVSAYTEFCKAGKYDEAAALRASFVQDTELSAFDLDIQRCISRIDESLVGTESVYKRASFYQAMTLNPEKYKNEKNLSPKIICDFAVLGYSPLP